MRILSFLFLSIFFFTACERTVEIDLLDRESKLVVEGTIENGQYPRVILSRSLDYYSKITPAILESSYIHGAKVTVSNGTRTHQLKEYSTRVSDSLRIYYYAADPASSATVFRGALNGTYTLRIEADGKVFNATTTIPANDLKLDDMWWEPTPGTDTNKVRVMVRATDPPERGNYVRYFTARNRQGYLPGLNSVTDDQVVNGTSFNIPVDAGFDRSQKLDLDDYGFFRRGDTVSLKFCNIDRGTYDFWRTLDFAFSAAGNPFTSPVKVLGNVEGALGYWGGYGVQYKTIIIPK
ncbi:DUF4249 domain-containing protein [Chitinophaga sedimenti]|uniref:DUF4249 domain-containing protein n=1 Tax=Chitinophaga sedimenti TaxID=2033606 RepID=UPI0020057B9F|nr:DUF4249 domain-containing protein [Chitinophaga sedimenti]MCK7553858.1 DUF4249 domain-containing protein [Chitinophaga sedimenti]